MRRIALVVFTVSVLLLPFGCVMAKANKATFCKELRHTPSMSEVFGALRTDDPSALRIKARQTAQRFVKLQRSAPREIRSQVSDVAQLATKVANAVEDSPNDPEAVAAALRREVSDSIGPTKAALELARYSSDECHFNLNDPTGAVPLTSTPTTFSFVPTTR